MKKKIKIALNVLSVCLADSVIWRIQVLDGSICCFRRIKTFHWYNVIRLQREFHSHIAIWICIKWWLIGDWVLYHWNVVRYDGEVLMFIGRLFALKISVSCLSLLFFFFLRILHIDIYLWDEYSSRRMRTVAHTHANWSHTRKKTFMFNIVNLARIHWVVEMNWWYLYIYISALQFVCVRPAWYFSQLKCICSKLTNTRRLRSHLVDLVGKAHTTQKKYIPIYLA